MLKFPKIIIITFALYMLLCIPALAAQAVVGTVGGYVSNTPMAAGPNASIGEVWMRHGGARLQYDALMGSVQTNTNGRMRRDPAAITTLPPLYPQKRVVKKTKKTSVSKAKKAPTKVNPSPKPVLPKKTSDNNKSPYTGTAPAAPSANEQSPASSNKVTVIPSPSPSPAINAATPSSLTPASTAVSPPPNPPSPSPNSSAQSNVR